MSILAKQALALCTNTSTPLTQDSISLHLSQLDNWHTYSKNDTMRIAKSFNFKNYVHGITFANNIAELAELENHHPKICIEWGKVTITWWTHSINGLFINDFIMAARCDDIYAT